MSDSYEKAEKGYVFGLQKYFEETEYSIGANPLFELSYLDNYNGNNYRSLTTATFDFTLASITIESFVHSKH